MYGKRPLWGTALRGTIDNGPILQVSLESRESDKAIAGVKYLIRFVRDDPV